MNKEIKAVYFCYTSAGRWGKGLTLDSAMLASGITSGRKTTTKYVVMAAILDNPDDAELNNIKDCITANQFYGSPMYYNDGRTSEDQEAIDRLHVGWLTVIDKSK